MPFTIAIDGPAASGKGTIARALAERFGFHHLDTGLLYRAVGAMGGDPIAAAQALSAFASEAAILLAHSEIDVKSNEIPAAQRMIAELGLTGVLFTADALHCQKN